MIQPFAPIEIALKEVLEQWYPDKVGGDMSFEAGEGLYIMVGLVDGHTTKLGGEWVVDIDIFADDYATAIEAASDIEAKLLDGAHRGGGMILDGIYQSLTARPMPWDDDNVTRLGAVYGMTARRSG